MIITTNKSVAINELLKIRKSRSHNIGIINKKFYLYGLSGGFVFDLRPEWEKDNGFPGIRSSKQSIPTKQFVDILQTSDYEYQYYCD